jgi:disulfide oxidoreductase YuzD
LQATYTILPLGEAAPIAVFLEKTMDPITTAIVAALPALASDLIQSSVKDAYAGLKAIIRRKWGDSSPLAKSVDALEANPESKGQAEVLAEHVAAVNATADADVMQALAKLIEQLKKEGLGGKQIAPIAVNISGGTVQGIVAAQNVSIDTMNFGAPPASKKR